MRALTSTIVDAGRVAPKVSPWTGMTSDARAMSVTNIGSARRPPD